MRREQVNRLMLRYAFPLSILLYLVSIPAFASNQAISLKDLIGETQRQTEDPERIGLVWWLPVEFWEASMATGPAASTQEQIAAFTSPLREYTMFAIADGNVGQFGGVTWFSKEDLRGNIVLQDAAGTRFMPLAEEQVSSDARNLAAMMKPVLASMLGPLGESIEFFFFPGVSPDGRKIADARAEGFFRLKLSADEHEWRLPLGSLLPKKSCPVDGQRFNGAWKFCPWHGKKLRAHSE